LAAPTPPSSSAPPPEGAGRARLRAAWWLAALAVLLLAGGGVLGRFGWDTAIDRPGPLATAQAVVVPHGDSQRVAEALRRAGVIGDVALFRAAAWITRRQGVLHAAELAFPAHASLRQVLAVLRTAPAVLHRLTIPEGLSAPRIAALIQVAPAAAGSAETPPEGAVLPQTYDYTYGTPRAAILARAEAAMQSALSMAWADRAPDLPLTSPRDALILASIVEQETALPAERSRIAAVFLNRLRLGMRLDADPTVAYAADHGTGPLGHALTRADLDSDDPFNTYRHNGLPPGPICSPGIASIQAVLHPAATDDLYFVADGTGGHAFAHTLKEQDRNIARWRALTAPAPYASPGHAD
jgi:UPF0755 protein